ncbi:PEP-CTERM sorting domain-containing protein [Nostoc parmelioides]|uniref:PEP-CTERM sorting domain-containing protein n=1 Tax=Nostoc parmelioides FACHB-3921 TaxID=2692909 RepID=A0ABR8B9R1_9NOSO|nr:PEP-CTERM sorting domain-containing protein [Nostoc parmelioides]MBD2250832.1 PEP-CTERM sorting domain-containing protein [Nostoc parmelioides FACHB-3921]
MKLAKHLSIVTINTIVGFTSVFVSSSAQAAQIFNFQYSFPSYDADGTSISARGKLFTTDLDPINQKYTITGISGTRTVKGITESIIGLLSPSTYGNNDNLLNASQPLLTTNGFSYLVAGDGEDGQGNVNVFYSSLSDGYSEFSSDVDFGSFSVTPHSVPEPYTVVGLLVTLGFGSWMKRRQAV